MKKKTTKKSAPKGAKLIKPLSAMEEKLLDMMYHIILDAKSDNAPDARAGLAHKYATLIGELLTVKPTYLTKLIEACEEDLKNCITENAPTEGHKPEFIAMCKEAKDGMDYKLGILRAFVKNRDKIIQCF